MILSGKNKQALHEHPDYNVSDFVNTCAEMGYSFAGCNCVVVAMRLRDLLTKDAFVSKIMPYLLLCGFRPPKPKKVGKVVAAKEVLVVRTQRKNK